MIAAPDTELTKPQYHAICDLVYRVCGIHLHDGKEGLVRTRLQKRLRELGLSSITAYLEHLAADRSGEEVAMMVDVLTTNKTSFFREPDHFAFLRDVVVPDAAPGEPLRLWSAGCSTGEEPYTLAMVLAETMRELGSREVRILATDISARVLERARAAEYPEEALLDVPAALRQRYLASSGASGRSGVRPELREMVHLARLNLMDPWPMRGRFHAIFCRNVMIYFDRATQERLVERFRAQLIPGGYLFVGHSESLTGLEHGLTYVQPAVYRA